MNVKKNVVSIALALTMVSQTAFAAAVPTFTDVPTTHWAHESITEMAERGVVNGVGDGLFAPSSSVTYAQFITMLTREFYDAGDAASGAEWYTPYMTIAQNKNLLSGCSMSSPNAPINRYDMAQVMYNIIKDDAPTGSSSGIADWSSVPSNYQTAVSVCYAMGLIKGMDDGTFSGQNTMNRAQAATVIDRLIDAGAGSSQAPSTEIPAGAVQVTEDMTNKIGGHGSYYSNGTYYMKSDGWNSKNATLGFENPGYSKVTFTITVYDKTHAVLVGGNDGIGSDVRLSTADAIINAGNSATYTVDISGITNTVIRAINGTYANYEITNIYLHD